MEKMFEVAIRNKYRFPFKGQVSVEDLWDMAVGELDSVFKSLNAQVKQAKEESLLAVRSAEDTVLDTKIEIVKYIVGIKLEETAKMKQARERREQKQKIMAIMADKQEQELHGKSVDELQAMLDSLD